MNIGISMNHEFRISQFLWTHEFHFWKIHAPMNMKTDIAINSWIWISNFSWTHEYEYGHVTLWTFKSSYSSSNCMNHAMNHMNCNAWKKYDTFVFIYFKNILRFKRKKLTQKIYTWRSTPFIQQKLLQKITKAKKVRYVCFYLF